MLNAPMWFKWFLQMPQRKHSRDKGKRRVEKVIRYSCCGKNSFAKFIQIHVIIPYRREKEMHFSPLVKLNNVALQVE